MEVGLSSSTSHQDENEASTHTRREMVTPLPAWLEQDLWQAGSHYPVNSSLIPARFDVGTSAAHAYTGPDNLFSAAASMEITTDFGMMAAPSSGGSGGAILWWLWCPLMVWVLKIVAPPSLGGGASSWLC